MELQKTAMNRMNIICIYYFFHNLLQIGKIKNEIYSVQCYFNRYNSELNVRIVMQLKYINKFLKKLDKIFKIGYYL